VSEKTISVKVDSVVHRVFSDLAETSKLTVAKWLEMLGRQQVSPLKTLPDFEPVTKRKTGLNPAQGEIPTQIVELFKSRRKMAFTEIVDTLESIKSEGVHRRNIRNAILRLSKNGTLSMDDGRIVSLAKRKKS
jgi:hypothetical protein